MSGVTINQGTNLNIAADAIGTTNYQIIKLDRGAAGASSLFTGTIDAVTSVANIVGGTITQVKNAGTTQGGTVNVVQAGTVSTIGLTHADAWGTVIQVGTSTLGTIKAAVSGSSIYVTDLTISAGTVATNVQIASGGTSTPIMGTLFFAANGGMVNNFRTPIFTASGSALVFKQSADVPLTITAQGYVK